MEHCIAKIREIIARKHDDRRSILQLGYNLGRLSELSGGGRGPYWDRWKGPVADWNLDELEELARQLPFVLRVIPSIGRLRAPRGTPFDGPGVDRDATERVDPEAEMSRDPSRAADVVRALPP